MLGLLAELTLKQTPEAAAIQLSAIVIGILACLRWLNWLYEHKWERKCCGKTPHECKCGQCLECGLWWGNHRFECSARRSED